MPRLGRLTFFIAALYVCAVAPPVSAQDRDTETPAHISFVDGTAVLERDGRTDSAPASMPLLAGDRVRTNAGRVEILYADGSTLHLDANSLVDFQSDDVIRLLNGRVRLNIAGADRRVEYRVDAPSAWIDIAAPGEYRVAVLTGEEVELAVLRGRAELVNEDGRTMLAAGERAFARMGAGPSPAYVYNSAAWDAFDRWSENRRDSRLGVSAEYLPESVQPYASTFNQYGYWQNVPTYGYVWYPRVSVGWRPYYHGRWVTLRPWGWTWIGADPWAWPTHHFGRWGFSAGAWFWIPGRTWGPAHVSWAYAPGYVSWCPLGWNNRPVFSFINVNIFGGRRYDPWHAWTVVPYRGFGRGFVNVNVINASRLDVRAQRAFVVRDTQPDFRGYAVPRSSAPIRTAVSRTGDFGGTAAFRGSPRVGSAGPASRTPGAAAPADNDPTAAFRSRRSGSAPLSGPGYPPAARTPDRTATPSYGRESPSSAERRAVPRSAPGNTAPAPETSSPRRSAPDYRASPSRGASTPESSPDRGTPDGYRRAVPRGGDGYSPSPSYGGVQRERNPSSGDRNPYSAPPSGDPGDRPRAMPRSAPYSAPPDRGGSDRGGDNPGYRPRGGSVERGGGVERSAPAPSGPPPSRGVERSAPRDSGSNNSGSNNSGGGDRAGSRSRGDGQSTGRAVSRGRGGR
ncbi:MAG TPA: DUF6600 domain-containing protein [Vicinamibacterales bacterium]|jgi:hypothetical protein